MVFLKIRYNGKIDIIPDISKMAPVSKLMAEVAKITGLAPKEQRLLCRGKELDKRYTLFDFQIDRNMIIDVHKRMIFEDKPKDKEKEKEIREDADKENKDGNGSDDLTAPGATDGED